MRSAQRFGERVGMRFFSPVWWGGVGCCGFWRHGAGKIIENDDAAGFVVVAAVRHEFEQHKFGGSANLVYFNTIISVVFFVDVSWKCDA